MWLTSVLELRNLTSQHGKQHYLTTLAAVEETYGAKKKEEKEKTLYEWTFYASFLSIFRDFFNPVIKCPFYDFK